jgi:hypothetical protein
MSLKERDYRGRAGVADPDSDPDVSSNFLKNL